MSIAMNIKYPDFLCGPLSWLPASGMLLWLLPWLAIGFFIIVSQDDSKAFPRSERYYGSLGSRGGAYCKSGMGWSVGPPSNSASPLMLWMRREPASTIVTFAKGLSVQRGRKHGRGKWSSQYMACRLFY